MEQLMSVSYDAAVMTGSVVLVAILGIIMLISLFSLGFFLFKSSKKLSGFWVKLVGMHISCVIAYLAGAAMYNWYQGELGTFFLAMIGFGLLTSLPLLLANAVLKRI